jgi:hypothetical protein
VDDGLPGLIPYQLGRVWRDTIDAAAAPLSPAGRRQELITAIASGMPAGLGIEWVDSTGRSAAEWRHDRRLEIWGPQATALRRLAADTRLALLASSAMLSPLFAPGMGSPLAWAPTWRRRTAQEAQALLDELALVPCPDTVRLRYRPYARLPDVAASRYAGYRAATSLGRFWILHNEHCRRLPDAELERCPSWYADLEHDLLVGLVDSEDLGRRVGAASSPGTVASRRAAALRTAPPHFPSHLPGHRDPSPRLGHVFWADVRGGRDVN